MLCDPPRTPPLSHTVRSQAGHFLRELQRRTVLQWPHWKAIPQIGPGCGELRFSDGENRKEWRLFVCCTDTEVILLDIHEKKTQKTPQAVIERCRRRLKAYLAG